MGRRANSKIRRRVLEQEFTHPGCTDCDSSCNACHVNVLMWLEFDRYKVPCDDKQGDDRARKLFRKKRNRYFDWLQW